MPDGLFRNTYRIPSARLKDWDYSAPGYYYVTICTKNKKVLFGKVVEIEEEPGATTHLSPIGMIIDACWKEIPEHHRNVTLDDFVILPNHLHGIVVIEEHDSELVETPYMASLHANKNDQGHHRPEWKPGSLGAVIQQFKRACTHRIHQAGFADFAWQPRFYDHIIRNEKDLARVQQYIRENPVAWLYGEDED